MEIFCFIIPILATVPLIIYSCVIGGRAWQGAKQVQGEAATVLRYLALNLCEPVVGTPLVLASLLVSNAWDARLSPGWSMCICWPMLVLLIPVFGPHLQNTKHREIALNSILLSIVRLVLNAGCFGLVGNGNSNSNFIFIVFILPCISIGFLLYTTFWAEQKVTELTTVPLPPLPPLPAHAVSIARPAATIAPVPMAPMLISHRNAVPCPDCNELIVSNAAVCDHCGLVFASKIPAYLQALPRYSILRPLREGGMSQIYLAHDRAIGDRCVIKVATSTEAHRCLEHEAHLLRSLNHRGVVSLLGWYADHGAAFAALNYVPGVSLEQELNLGRVPFAQALAYTRSAAETLCYLASRPLPIVHCDLKPGNLMVDTLTGTTVLLDFGSAIELRAGMQPPLTQEQYGTPGYAAPEQYRGNPTPRSDVYGLAATLYHLVTGDDPTLHPLRFPALTSLPSELATLLQQALMHDPEQRPSAFHFRNVLREIASHPNVS